MGSDETLRKDNISSTLYCAQKFGLLKNRENITGFMDCRQITTARLTNTTASSKYSFLRKYYKNDSVMT